LRGTQSLVGQMGWAFGRPSLVAIEVAWRWLFGAPFLFVCWLCTTTALNKTELWSSLSSLDAMNPWLAARQLAEISAIFQPAFRAFVVPWLLPAALVWIAVSSLGRAFIFYRLDTRLPFRPLKLAIPHGCCVCSSCRRAGSGCFFDLDDFSFARIFHGIRAAELAIRDCASAGIA